jgi:predicted molibdopterin-dependent oxidoreductase YjgC
MDEIGLAVASYEAADYDNLSRDYGRQWPCTKERPMGTERLFADGNGRPFRFALVERPTLPGGGSKDYPFALSFGFSLYYWHKNVLVQHSETLKREYQILLLDYPEGFVEVNVEDAAGLGIRDGCRIRLSSPTGVALTYARVTDEVKGGMVFVPYFLHDLTKQILGEASSPDHSVSAQVYVKLEVA